MDGVEDEASFNVHVICVCSCTQFVHLYSGGPGFHYLDDMDGEVQKRSIDYQGAHARSLRKGRGFGGKISTPVVGIEREGFDSQGQVVATWLAE